MIALNNLHLPLESRDVHLITRIKRFNFQSETWEHITRVLQEATMYYLMRSEIRNSRCVAGRT